MKMKLLTIIAIALISIPEIPMATEQVSDVLIIRGKRIFTYETPHLDEAFPKLEIPKFRMISTANYKGYNATWAVMRGQLHLVGLEGLVAESGEMLWDEKILRDQTFPVKVEAWSGVVKRVNPVSSLDLNTGKTERYDEVTTIVFEKGKVTKVEFDKKVPRKEVAE